MYTKEYQTHSGGKLVEYFNDRGERVRAVHSHGRKNDTDEVDELIQNLRKNKPKNP
jgi:hypothetical protein